MKELEQVYRDIHPKLFTFFYLKTSKIATSEDLTQDVFYEASKGLHCFRGIPPSPPGYSPLPIIC